MHVITSSISLIQLAEYAQILTYVIMLDSEKSVISTWTLFSHALICFQETIESV